MFRRVRRRIEVPNQAGYLPWNCLFQNVGVEMCNASRSVAHPLPCAAVPRRSRPARLDSGALIATLRALRTAPLSPHLEVETYTWDVLPEGLKTSSKADDVARELSFVLEELRDERVTARAAPLGTLLRLGRVSNLPTVWTNVVAATALAGGDPLSWRARLTLLAMTLFYVGEMYLNDAFDREIDRRERPGRPIPAGAIAAPTVFAIGFGLLGAGLVLMALCGGPALAAGLVLCGIIVFYDLHHKGNPLSPLVMSLCRLMVYVGAAAATVGFVPAAVWVGAVALAAHVVGLTYAAKQESLNRVQRLWPLAILALPLILAAPALFAHWRVALSASRSPPPTGSRSTSCAGAPAPMRCPRRWRH